jgi:hypothetical protein
MAFQFIAHKIALCKTVNFEMEGKAVIRPVVYYFVGDYKVF